MNASDTGLLVGFIQTNGLRLYIAGGNSRVTGIVASAAGVPKGHKCSLPSIWSRVPVYTFDLSGCQQEKRRRSPQRRHCGHRHNDPNPSASAAPQYEDWAGRRGRGAQATYRLVWQRRQISMWNILICIYFEAFCVTCRLLYIAVL
jgi:hypothetical protein